MKFDDKINESMTTLSEAKITSPWIIPMLDVIHKNKNSQEGKELHKALQQYIEKRKTSYVAGKKHSPALDNILSGLEAIYDIRVED